MNVTRNWDTASGTVEYDAGDHPDGQTFFDGSKDSQIDAKNGANGVYGQMGTYLHINKTNTGDVVKAASDFQFTHLEVENGVFDLNGYRVNTSIGVFYCFDGGTLRMNTGSPILDIDGTGSGFLYAVFYFGSGSSEDITQGEIQLSGYGENYKVIDLASGCSFQPSGSNVIEIDGDTPEGTRYINRDESSSYFNNLTLNTGDIIELSDNIDINRNLTISSGTLDANSSYDYNINIAGNWTNSDTFKARSGTVIFDGSHDAEIVTEGTTDIKDFYHVDISATGSTKTLSGYAIDIDGNFKITAGTLNPNSNDMTVGGNWDDSGGSFAPTSNIVYLTGSSKTIKTGSGNNFYDLTIQGSISTSTSNTVSITNQLTVESTHSLTVSPGDTLSCEDVSVSGTLTLSTDSSSNAILTFSSASSASLTVTGTLRLDGYDGTYTADVTSESGSRVTWDISGTFDANNYTITYPDSNGVQFSSPNIVSLENGTYDNPADNSPLLNLTGIGTIPTPIYGCRFDDSDGASSPYNVRGDSGTQDVQFRDYSGDLALDGSVAESNDDDPDNNIHWGCHETVGVNVVDSCKAFGDSITISFTSNGVSDSISLGNGATSETATIWADYGKDITWETDYTSGSERWHIDDDETNPVTAVQGGSWTKDYYHQYQNTFKYTNGGSCGHHTGIRVDYSALGETVTGSAIEESRTYWADCSTSWSYTDPEEDKKDAAPINNGVAAQYGASGTGYIMYSDRSVHDRFSSNPPHSDNADHFIAVIYDGSNWNYDDDTAYHTFTPKNSDVLVAEVDFDADTVTNLEGQDSTVNGIKYGYHDGDLTFYPNQWGGSSDTGEFDITGNYLEPNGGRWKWDETGSISGTVSGSNSYNPTYYHQYNITVSTAGAYLDATYSTTLYWANMTVQKSTNIHDDISPLKRWMDCGSDFDVDTPIDGPNDPRDYTYVCDDPVANVDEAINQGNEHTFLFHAEFSADVTIDGPDDSAQLGWSVSGGQDLENTGYDDVIVGGPSYEGDAGVAYVFHGGDWTVGGDTTLTPADSDWAKTGSGDVKFGRTVHLAADIPGAGTPNVMVSEPKYGTDQGRTHIYGLGDVMTLELEFFIHDQAGDTHDKFGGKQIEVDQDPGWYSHSIDTDIQEVPTGKSIMFNITAVDGSSSVTLVYGDTEYPSRYEMSKPLGEAKVDRVQTWDTEKDEGTGKWSQEYSESDDVTIRANVSADSAAHISNAKLSIKDLQGNVLIDGIYMSYHSGGTGWKLYQYTFNTSRLRYRGRFIARVVAIDYHGGTDEILGDTANNTVQFRVVEGGG